MIKLKDVLTDVVLTDVVFNKKQQIGNCVSILDNSDGTFNDATEMSTTIENDSIIPYSNQIINSFNLDGLPKLLKLNLRKYPSKVELGHSNNLYWLYDIPLDIHYFFI